MLLLILNLGSYDYILGYKQLEMFNILVNTHRHYLCQPQDFLLSNLVLKELVTPQSSLCPQLILQSHQDNVQTHDKAFAKEDQHQERGRELLTIYLLTCQNKLKQITAATPITNIDSNSGYKSANLTYKHVLDFLALGQEMAKFNIESFLSLA